MIRYLALITAVSVLSCEADETLRVPLETAYQGWRDSIIRKDANAWQRFTAPHRRIEVKNRIVSERRAFPSSVFDLPAPPPSLGGLKFLTAQQSGPTAKAAYFGKVDFGTGGNVSDNLLVLSFVGGSGSWLYDRAEFVNLAALPAVRKELAAGNLNYLKETPEAKPSGIIPPTPIEVPTAAIIAKVYVFCPGREVQVQVNKVSRHIFGNTKEADVIIGGARNGPNEISFSTKKLPDGNGKEVMTIRVYLMSQVPGVKPIKAYEYQIAAGEVPKPFHTETFTVDAEILSKLRGGK